MKFLFRFYLVLLFSFFFFSYYAYALDKNTKQVLPSDTPASLCSKNDGSVIRSSDGELDLKYIDGFKFAYFKSWYKNKSELNILNLPYLLESGVDDAPGILIHSITENLENDDFKLLYTSFNCQCPYGVDTFGLCKDESQITGIIDWKENKTDLDICTQGQNMPGVSVQLVYDGTATKAETGSFDWWGKTWVVGTPNLENLFYTRWNSMNALSIIFIDGYREGTGSQSGYQFIDYRELKCNCPAPFTHNNVTGVCEPVNCTPPQWEISSGVCAEPDVCPDGGQSLNGSCDRSCEDVGMVTYSQSSVDLLHPELTKICLDSMDCDAKVRECITKCGTQDNVENFLCDTATKTYQCACKDDTLDNIVDNENPDETTDAGDSLISNKYLQTIKDESLKHTQALDDIDSLLMQSNKNDLTRETQLGAIDGKLTTLDTSINSLKQGQDESNDWLESIFSKLSNLSDFFTNGSNTLETQANDLKNSIDSEVSNSDTLEDLDLNSETQTLLDNVVSKYSNALGLSTSYGTKPSNITVSLFEKTYTIIDFSLLDEHIAVIRGLFLSLAYLTGFVFLLRKV